MTDIAAELAKLHELTGASFSRQVEFIAKMGEFHLVEGEKDIFSAGGEQNKDYDNQLAAARKAVSHGYKAIILPNPKRPRTPDLILIFKNVYKIYDLKTIFGKSSASNRLAESIGQCNRILMNVVSDYDTRLMAADIKHFFEENKRAVEVLIFKGKKVIVIDRFVATHPQFYRLLKKKYEK